MSVKTTYEVELDDKGSIRAKTNDLKDFNKQADNSVSKAKAMKASYQSYDQGRATVGTGSAARDFAKESQGLGGLVRVYATFAANIFAVSAAFNALSAAVDTVNLVKGLDQIGAASGRNLGTLSKRLVEATDNSVSLREAMTATAQASSAGMSSTDILKLAKGAKQASQALGIDMSDALSRLSRGITKIEPELLDELGIFVRVDKAAQDYATSIGKPVSALSEFERRASFSAAVLDQLNTKFGSLEIDANPYNQLLASLKNVSTAGLDLVNRVLGPLAKMLGESPTALAVVLGLIGATLVKQAIPALGAWREELKKSAEVAKEHTAETKRMYDEYRAGTITADTSAQATAFKAASIAVNTHAAALTNLEGISKRTSLSKGITAFVAAPSAENAAIVLAQGVARQKALEAEVTKGVTAARATAINEELTGISKLKPAVDGLTASNKELNKTKSEYKGVSTGYWSLASMYERIDDAAKKSAKSIQIVNNAVENASLGPLLAISMATKEITAAYGAKQIGAVGAFFTAIKAGSAIAMVGINTLLASMAGVLNVIGLVVGFTTLLVSFFSDNAREASKFSSAIDDLKSSFDNVDRTINVISKKDPLAQMGIESTQARANAFMELSGKLDEASTAYTKLQDKSTNWLDSTLDTLKGIVNLDAASTLAAQMAAAMDKALLLLDDPAKKEELRAKFRDILGISSLSKGSVTEALKGALKSGDNTKLTDFDKTIADAGRSAASTALSLTNYSTAINTAVKANQEYLNTFNLTDPLAKLGISLITVSSSLQELTGSSKDSQTALIDLMGDTKKMSLFGTDFALGLLKIRDAYTESSGAVYQYTLELDSEKAKLQELIVLRDKAKSGLELSAEAVAIALGQSSPNVRKSEQTAVSAQQQIARGAEVRLEAATARFTQANVDAQKLISQGMQKSFKDGGDYIAMSLKNAQETAALTVAKAGTVGLTGVAALEAEAKLAKASDAVQLRVIEVNLQQIVIQSKLNNTIEQANRLQQLAIAERDKGVGSIEAVAAQQALEISQGIGKALGAGPKGIGAAVGLGKVSGASDTSIGIAQGLQGTLLATASTSAAKQAIIAQGQYREAADKYKRPVAGVAENTLPAIAQQKALNNLAAERLDLIKNIVGSESEQTILARSQLDIYNLALDSAAGNAVQQAKIVGLQDQLSVKALALVAPEIRQQTRLERMTQLRAEIVDKEKLSNIELKTSIALMAAKEARLVKELAITTAIRDLDTSRASTQLEIAEAQSAADLASGKITEDTKNNLDYQSTLAKVTQDAAGKRAQQIDLVAKATSKYNSILESSADLTQEDRDIALENLRLDTTAIGYRMAAIDSEEAGKRKLADINKKLSTQEQGIQDILLKGISNMSDGMIEFAMTGKASFGDMIQSMLLDLAKLEMRMMFMKSLEGVGGVSGLAGIIGSFLGGGTGTIPLQPGGGYAKGAAWQSGIEKFAMGGSFTNSIVNSPTLFKFAKGTGMMGEAGPEAIMPLKRDANGNLGVRAGQPSTDVNVVVNNYSSEPATAKETTDSRGNRRIEVTIGDMIAGEIGRAGSAAQGSIRNTFGKQPQLLRR